ncbi:MAG: thiopurine S-methyltransferase [Myxococcales bacterium]|jgi:thiopurine S-methyltransferase|nr:thiopurine S-methyltransferase [Myxococcales bacterium]
MHEDFWRKRWAENQIGFHEGKPNAHLQRFSERLRTTAQPRVLVPLCGKAADLAWLAAQGFLVTGVELVREAAEAFFQEHGLSAREERDGGLPCLAGERVRIAVGDFWRWDFRESAPIDAAYDRAALVAVRPEDRERYVRHLLAPLRPAAPILLVTFAYDQTRMSGPPFSVDAAEVQRLFASRCEIEALEDVDILEREPRFRARGLESLREQVWLLRVR